MGIACGFGERRNHNLLLFANGGKRIGQGELKDFFPRFSRHFFPHCHIFRNPPVRTGGKGGKSWTWTTGSKRFPFKNSYRSRLFSSFYSRNSGNRRNFYFFSNFTMASREPLPPLIPFEVLFDGSRRRKKGLTRKKARPLKIVRKSVTGGHLLPFRTFRAKIFIFCPSKSGKKLN